MQSSSEDDDINSKRHFIKSSDKLVRRQSRNKSHDVTSLSWRSILIVTIDPHALNFSYYVNLTENSMSRSSTIMIEMFVIIDMKR